MLNVRDANEEFEMKTQCLKRKSVDFSREKALAARGSSGKKLRGDLEHLDGSAVPNEDP